METSVIVSKLTTLLDEAKGAGSETVNIGLDVAESILGILDPETKEGEKEDAKQGDKPDPQTDGDLKEETFSASITKNLQNRRQKATKDSQHFGKVLPQVKVDEQDVDKALSDISGVTDQYLSQHGFLTHVYLNAAKRTGVDVEKYRDGLFIKFE